MIEGFGLMALVQIIFAVVAGNGISRLIDWLQIRDESARKKQAGKSVQNG